MDYYMDYIWILRNFLNFVLNLEFVLARKMLILASHGVVSIREAGGNDEVEVISLFFSF